MINEKNAVISRKNARTASNMRWRGAGMVSANNSSRLLLDYRTEQPEAYETIMKLIFGSEGVAVSHLKLEMGSDINSSSGTEPCVKRTRNEVCDTRRGAGFQLAADAKKINPELTLDLLWWSEPRWVSDAPDLYAARYQWYKQTLDSAYQQYGLVFDYVSATQNERNADYEWIKYLSKALKSEKNTPYPYSSIKIVAGEEVCSWWIADAMLADEELMRAVDVVGSHYTSRSTENARRLAEEYGKELWFSEGSSPASYPQGVRRFDGAWSGLLGINGVLDIANRLIMMLPLGGMTLCQLQPIVSAYYDGVCYCQKHLILADSPWNAWFCADAGFYMILHFSQYIRKGWAVVDGASFADAKDGGDGHALVDSTFSCLTTIDPDGNDFSIVITNTTSEPICYHFTLDDVKGASLNIIETCGGDKKDYAENYFRHTQTIDASNGFNITVKPFSMLTATTLEPVEAFRSTYHERKLLELPYADDFSYAEYPEDYISSRGGAPRYFTDEGGAFEVEAIDGEKLLRQQILKADKANEWGGTPSPVTNFGDDRWFSYASTVSVEFEPSEAPDENYVGVGIRYILACDGESGYWLQLYENGEWKLRRRAEEIASGKLNAPLKTARLQIRAVRGSISCLIDGELLAEYQEAAGILAAGRGALYSSYNRNRFKGLLLEPLDHPYIERFDDTDACLEYSGDWSHNADGFRSFKRTISIGAVGASFVLSFRGTGFALVGENPDGARLSVTIDGAESIVELSSKGAREICYISDTLAFAEHRAEVRLLSERFVLDSVEIQQ